MKKIYIIFSFLSMILLTSPGNAMVWNVTVNSSSFSPNSLPNVVCGDTVRWTYGSGNPHTTTSTTIPAGATTWNAPIDGSNTTFDYIVPNFAGVYNYKCTPHGFLGSFTVTCTAGINDMQSNISSLIYPNPFASSFTLANSQADAAKITDMTGQVVHAVSLNTLGDKAEINLDALAPGIYFLITYKEGIIQQSQKIVKAK